MCFYNSMSAPLFLIHHKYIIYFQNCIFVYINFHQNCIYTKTALPSQAERKVISQV